jgi:protein FAM32A
MSSGGVTVIGGKLKFKGSSTSKTTKKRKSTEEAHEITSSKPKENKEVSHVEPAADSPSVDLHLTEAQKRHKQRRLDLEKKELKKLVETTHLDRIERFNYKLSKMTEHNDIPRVSAAGNG